MTALKKSSMRIINLDKASKPVLLVWGSGVNMHQVIIHPSNSQTKKNPNVNKSIAADTRF
ncbi:hypothetical protein HQ545_02475 [Candidatus Woesearchaeota archaeon]|nr:hypothetical protein [Candidatus Woesearchaeota archaeon]